MKLIKIDKVLKVKSDYIIDGELVIEVDCSEYTEYKRLPCAVRHHSGIRLVKTGWSSDLNYACYKQERLGQLVDFYV